MRREPSLIAWGALLALWWGLIWWFSSEVDRRHCERYGVEYAGTTLGLDGYCRISGVDIPAETLQP